jgi:putative ABC transport system ATP-binding protein
LHQRVLKGREKKMLEIKNISKTFSPGTVNEKKAISGLSLTVNDGDFITIIGSNGAGKSTLFNAIAGSFFVDEGYIILGGQDITFLEEHKRSRVIGRMFQDPLKGTAPSMTIEENLALAYLRSSEGTSPFSRISARDKKNFREQLSKLGMGLEDRMKDPVGLLSGGQRQALTLLMATFVTPKILLLDEHTAALDPGTAEKVIELTKSIVETNNITCLMITHNMKQALSIGNRTLLMNDGQVVLDVTGSERASLTTADLIDKFRKKVGEDLDNDRILLST